MVADKPSRGRPRGPETVLFPIKGPADLRRRLKVACAEEGLTYAQLIGKLLDQRDANTRRAVQRQAHPFHRPASGQ